jgi:membrane-bound metal-dependent hydrolase YbcI (DUF457 family)
MFVGHYAAAIAAKAIEPRAPLWALAGAAQLVDIGWSVLIAAGIERASVDPALPGSTFVLEHMPWTHSLPAALVWSLAAALLARAFLWSWRASAIIGAVVFSHWLLDLLVHRPDLELWPGGEKVGLALWNHPVPEQAVEIGLIAIACVFWGAARRDAGRRAWPAALFIGFLIALQLVAMLMPAEAGPVAPDNAGLVLVVYVLVIAAAWLTDRGQRRT